MRTNLNPIRVFDDEGAPVDQHVFADYIRQVTNKLMIEKGDMPNKDEYEFRYEQTGDTYRLQGFFGSPEVNRTAHGTLATRPPWLVKIIDVAVVAGVVRTVANPPPDLILWFCTDKEFNLTEYVDV